jgi:hypothetical protein
MISLVSGRPPENSLPPNMHLTDVLPGESGSVVVDQDTFAVYGHVIGSDRLGHALTVPLCDTIQQVAIAFNSSSVCLPKEAKHFETVASDAPDGNPGRHQSPIHGPSRHKVLEGSISDALETSQDSPQMSSVQISSELVLVPPSSSSAEVCPPKSTSLPDDPRGEPMQEEGFISLFELWYTETPPTTAPSRLELFDSLAETAHTLSVIHQRWSDGKLRLVCHKLPSACMQHANSIGIDLVTGL